MQKNSKFLYVEVYNRFCYQVQLYCCIQSINQYNSHLNDTLIMERYISDMLCIRVTTLQAQKWTHVKENVFKNIQQTPHM